MSKKKVEYQDILCPKCKEKVISHTAIDYIYGNPIRNCPFCGEEYLDPYVHEIAVDGLRKDPRLVKKLWKDLAVCLGLTLFMFVMNIVSVALDSVSFLMIAFMFVFLFLGLYKITLFFVNKKDQKKQMAKQIEQSEERLADKAYALKLKSYGCKVPEKYL